LPRGARVRVRLGDIDEVSLDVHGTVIERLDLPLESEAELEADEEDELAVAGPIAIAVDLSEPAADNLENGSNPAETAADHPAP